MAAKKLSKKKVTKKKATKKKATKKKVAKKKLGQKSTKKKTKATKKLGKKKVATKKAPGTTKKATKKRIKNSSEAKKATKKTSRVLVKKTTNKTSSKAEVSDGVSIGAFSVKNQAGQDFSHLDLQAGKFVLFFYPKDMTSGCTVEANDFERLSVQFLEKGYKVLGVSRDSVKSHEKFCKKEGLHINLLSDPDEQLCQMFQVIKEKSLYGRTYLGIDRSTFLIEGGEVRREWRGVKVPGHAEEVLKSIDSHLA